MSVALIGFNGFARKTGATLIDAGHRLAVYDPVGSCDPAAPKGVRVASSIADACGSADAVLTMICSDHLLDEAALGPDGIIGALPKNGIHVSLGRISVACADRLVKAHWDAGDAPAP